MYVCMYVCVHTHMYVCLSLYVYVCINTDFVVYTLSVQGLSGLEIEQLRLDVSVNHPVMMQVANANLRGEVRKTTRAQ